MATEGSRLPSVLLVAMTLNRGGAEKQLTILARTLASRRYAVSVLCLSPIGPYYHDLLEAGVAVYSHPVDRSRRGPLDLMKVLSRIVRLRPDLVIGFLPVPILLARLSRLLPGRRRIICAHRNEIVRNRGIRLALRLTSWLSDREIANSGAALQRLKMAGLVGKQSLVIPNAIDEASVGRLRERDERAGADPHFRWVAVGSLTFQKGYDRLISAMYQLGSAGQGSRRLKIVGDGPLRSDLEERIQSLGLLDSVELLGESSDVPSILAAADGFVLASRWEGMPNALMEAMACGLPCVATRVGGVEELLGRLQGAIVVANDDGAIVDGMLQAESLADVELQAAGREAREAVLKRFGERRVMQQWLNLIRSLLVAEVDTRRR